MKDQFTITIHDSHGIKQFNLHSIFKRFGMYVLVFLIFVFALSGFSIAYLNTSVDTIAAKKNQMNKAYTELKDKNKKLIKTVSVTEETLRLKRDELVSVTDKLSDIENLIGLSSNTDTNLQERVDLAKVTSEEMFALMQHVPTG